MLRFVSLLLAAVSSAFACSVPQFDPTRRAVVESVDALIDHGHFRRALAELSARPVSAEAVQAKVGEDAVAEASVSGTAASGASLSGAIGSARKDYLLSRIELGLGQLDEAMRLASRAVAAEPGNAAYHVQVAAVAGVTAEHAAMFKQLGLAKRAKKELDEAISLDPKNADALDGLMLYDEKAPSFIGGDKAKAQKMAEQLTAIDPARGYIAQATLAHDRNDAAAEEMLLNKAVGADPNNYEAQIALATFLKRLDPPRTDDAEEHACMALMIDPGRTEAWQLLAGLAALQGCGPEVAGLIATARSFNPEDLSPEYSAAVEYIAAGRDLDYAQRLLRDYLDKPQEGDRPSAGRARYEMALALSKQGQNDQAAFLIRLALREDPTLDEARKDLKRLEHTP